jgi:hypothetical protein
MQLVGRASAGCLVGKSVEAHQQFMKFFKSDRRYKASNAYIFNFFVVSPGDKL